MYTKEKKGTTKIQLAITLILVVMICITSATYAYFAISENNSNTITGSMATVNLDLQVTKVFPAQNANSTNVMVPQLSTNAALTSALKGSCVDQNRNIACQVYKVEITNVQGITTTIVDGKISFYSNAAMTTDISSTMPNLKWRLVTNADGTTPANSTLGNNPMNAANATGTTFASGVELNQTNNAYTYYIMVWINEINTDQADKSTLGLEKKFYGKISFDASNGTGVTAYFQT